MKSLYDYELLLHDVFHRNWHILTYLEEHKALDALEKECISNTIMDALVYKGLIDLEKQSLDLEHFCIVEDVKHFCYQKTPHVTGFPLWLKEQLRKKSLSCSCSAPAIFMFINPCGGNYCLYDPCITLSAFFSDFSLDDYIYDSPTRKGYRLRKEEARPFLEVRINGVSYLMDVLLKRMYQKEWFIKTYHACRVYTRSKTEFYMKEGCKEQYFADIQEKNNFASYLSMKVPFILPSPANSEVLYELEMSKVLFPEDWDKYEKEKINGNLFF